MIRRWFAESGADWFDVLISVVATVAFFALIVSVSDPAEYGREGAFDAAPPVSR